MDEIQIEDLRKIHEFAFECLQEQGYNLHGDTCIDSWEEFVEHHGLKEAVLILSRHAGDAIA